jgi:hypothetical protein
MTTTVVSVRSYTHAITHVTNNVMRSLKNVISLSGLDPAKFTGDWVVVERGLQVWIESGHLQTITLEIFNSRTDAPLGFWDVGISYSYTSGDGAFWTDTDAIRYAVQKAGVHPSTADYRVIVTNSPGRPDVPGWSATAGRSRDGFIVQHIGTTVEASGLSGSLAYYRKG